MREEKTEGILLQTIPYLGQKKILKILSQNDGLLSLFVQNRSHLPFTNPFLIAEWVYSRKSSAIHSLKDVSLLQDLSDLRIHYETLNHAGQIAQDILRTQLSEKKGHGPYALVTAYLSKLPHVANPEVLVASFRLKLLMHDGLLRLQNECSQCKSCASFLEGGESFCLVHGSQAGSFFGEEEWEILHQLTFTRQFSAFQGLKLSLQTQEKIKKMFYRSYQ